MSGPSAFEQTMLERINRFRLDPADAFDALILDARRGLAHDPDVSLALRHFGVDLPRLETALAGLPPAAPLAWSAPLSSAAAGHAALMASEGVQSHRVGRDRNGDGLISRNEFLEPDLAGRAEAAGYDHALLGENVFAYAQSADHAHAAMIVDWGSGPGGMQDPAGHRLNLIDPRFTEIGLGAIRSPGSAAGAWSVTQMLGARFDAAPMLVGAIWRDRNGDGAYSPGEGMEDVRVRVEGDGATRSWTEGGYQIAAEGPARIVFSGALPRSVKVDAELGHAGAKIDLVDGGVVESSASLTEVAGLRGIRLLGVADIDARGRAGADHIEGNAGDNMLAGGRGADRLRGMEGHDALHGGAGGDRLLGGPGRDRLLGHRGADDLRGQGGSDVLKGGAGRDTLAGGAGRDRLHGGAGDDALTGGGGRDVLDGGTGNDLLTGGPGADLFRFGRHGGSDVILDFSSLDRIDLRGLGLDRDDLRVHLSEEGLVVSFEATSILLADVLAPPDADAFLL